MDKMVSTKLPPAEKKALEEPRGMGMPDYPWGMRLRFEKHICDGLGIKELPPAGTKMRLTIDFEVDENWSRESDMGDDRGFAGVVTGVCKEEDEPKVDASRVMYGEG